MQDRVNVARGGSGGRQGTTTFEQRTGTGYQISVRWQSLSTVDVRAARAERRVYLQRHRGRHLLRFASRLIEVGPADVLTEWCSQIPEVSNRVEDFESYDAGLVRLERKAYRSRAQLDARTWRHMLTCFHQETNSL
jgi:hypothetical protein